MILLTLSALLSPLFQEENNDYLNLRESGK